MRRRIFSIIALALFLAGLAAAQTTAVPFVIRSQQPNQTQILADNGTVSFVADSIGANTDAVISLTYRPSSLTMNLAINQVEVTGSTDFSSSNVPDLTTLQVLSSDNPGFAFHLRYKPQSSKAASGRVIVTFTEYDSAVLVNRKDRVASFSLNLNGTAPEFAYAYAVPPAGNSTLLSPDDTVVIPATNLNETSAATISLVNRGSGPGLVNSITLTGPDRFALGGVPFLPVTVDAGKSVQFTVRFTPLVLEMVSGSVNVTLSTGATLGFRVQGSGLASSYAYEILNARGAVRLTPGETVTLPEAPIGGEKTLTTIRVTNTGNADGKITAVSTAGTAFSVAEAPFLPYTLLAGKSSTVVVAFSPSQPGKSTGRLRIGDDAFELEGTALGSNLTFSYGSSISVANLGTVVFPSTSVGGTNKVLFTVRNEGNAATQVTSISAAGTGTTFTLSGLPALPTQLGAGQSVSFTATFSPVTSGNNSGTLKIDTQSFTLSGFASPPPALSPYTFSGAGGAIDSQQQPLVGLSLSSAYPLALTGTLTLGFSSDVFSSDPAVQFASGGRTIAFTIAAGAQSAVFANGASQVRLQTGTVAGVISLTPSFATASGGIDVTPASPAALSLNVAQAAPRILNVLVSSRTTDGFTLQVTGYATGRSITQMDFQFVPLPGENVTTTKLSVPVEAAFNTWYQSTASQAYGSQFTVTVPFTLQGTLTNAKTLAETIQSVSVTLTNRQGASAASSIVLR